MSADPLERFSLVLAIAAGTITLAFVASVGAVWPYPYPRALFLAAAFRSGAASILLLCCSAALVEDVSVRSRPLSYLLPIGAAILAGLFFVSAVLAVTGLTRCTRPTDEVCNLTADKATPEQLRQLEAAIPRWQVY